MTPGPTTPVIEKNLRRSMRTPGLVVHYITSVMGVGVLVLPGVAAHLAGPASLVSWAVLVLWSYPFALVFARMSVLRPSAGGVADFVQSAYGDVRGRQAAVFLLITLIIANPLLGLASGRYLAAVVAPGASNRAVLGIGALVILATIAANVIGLQLSTRMQGALLAVLIAFLIVVIVVALPQSDTARMTPFAPQGWQAVGPALLTCFFGFIGWENAAPVAEEVVDPARTFPRAIAVAVVIVGVLYLAMALTVVLSASSSGLSGGGITAFGQVLRGSVGDRAATAGNLVAFVLMALTANAWCLGTSRVIYSTARRGLLPAKLATVDGRGTPQAAVISLTAFYGLSVAALVSLDLQETALITCTSAAFLLIFLVSVLSGGRLLPSGRLRALAYGVAGVTVLLLPFFLSSLPWALGIVAVALGVERAFWRAGRASSSAASTE